VTAAMTARLVPVSRASRPVGIEVDALAREAGLHPDVVVQFVRLGLVDVVGGTREHPRFARDAPARLARAGRLRRDLGVGYAGAVLACDLLARIDVLERRLAAYERTARVAGAVASTAIGVPVGGDPRRSAALPPRTRSAAKPR
jgi:chaperone modulatory protein CbpM